MAGRTVPISRLAPTPSLGPAGMRAEARARTEAGVLGV